MTRLRVLALLSLSVLGIVTLCTSQFSLTGHAKAQDLACTGTQLELNNASAAAGAITLVETHNLYRFQERPYVRLPLGVKLALSAPAGASEADVHRAAECAASSADESSPLSVPGSALRVLRNGSRYELHVTAKDQKAAREIQRRAERLR